MKPETDLNGLLSAIESTLLDLDTLYRAASELAWQEQTARLAGTRLADTIDGQKQVLNGVYTLARLNLEISRWNP